MPKPFECSSGNYTGTGAAQTVTLGFKPKFLWIFNETDGDSMVFSSDGIADGKCVSIVGAAGPALVAANGVTLSATGFSVGTDASVSELAKVFEYVAIGGN